MKTLNSIWLLIAVTLVFFSCQKADLSSLNSEQFILKVGLKCILVPTGVDYKIKYTGTQSGVCVF